MLCAKTAQKSTRIFFDYFFHKNVSPYKFCKLRIFNSLEFLNRTEGEHIYHSVAKLSTSSNSSWAEMAIFPINPATHPPSHPPGHPPTRPPTHPPDKYQNTTILKIDRSRQVGRQLGRQQVAQLNWFQPHFQFIQPTYSHRPDPVDTTGIVIFFRISNLFEKLRLAPASAGLKLALFKFDLATHPPNHPPAHLKGQQYQ